MNIPRYSFKHWLVMRFIICGSALVINFIPKEIQDLIVGIILLLATMSGALFLILSLLRLFKKPGPAA